MADSSGIRAGLAYYELSLKDGKLTKGLRAWKGKLAAFGASVKAAGLKIMGLGSAMASPFAAAVGVFSSMGSEMARMSQRTGVSVEALSQLAFAAKESGVETEGLEMGLKKMQQKLGESLQGNAAAINSFAMLGVNINNLRNLSPDKQFELIADKIAAIQDPARRVAAEMEIFGKTGTQLGPLLAGGAAGIQKLRQEADKLGLTMSSKDANASLEFSLALEKLWDSVKMGAFRIGAALAPILQELAGKITGYVAMASKWISAHKGVIVTVGKIVAAVLAAGAALVVFGQMASTASSAISGVSLAMKIASFGVGLLSSTIGVATAAFGFLLSPIGLVVAAVVGLGATIAVQTGAAKSAMDFLGNAFGVLKNDAVTAFGGIKDALAAGDFKLAAQILWATLKLEWTRGINFLDTQWIEFCGMFSDAWTKAVYFTAGVFTEVWAGLQAGWEEICGVLCDAWSTFTGFIQSAWQTAIGFVAKGWARITSLFDGTDYDKIAADIDKESNAKLKSIEDKKNQEIFDREKKRKANLNAIERDRVGTLAALKDAKEAELAEHAKARAEKEKALQQEITDLIVKRDGFIQRAADGRNGSGGSTSEEALARDKAWHAAHDGAVDLMKNTQAGTFNAMTAGRALGGEGHAMVQHLVDAKRILHSIDRGVKKFHVEGNNF
jgi:ribosomal protein S11